MYTYLLCLYKTIDLLERIDSRPNSDDLIVNILGVLQYKAPALYRTLNRTLYHIIDKGLHLIR